MEKTKTFMLKVLCLAAGALLFAVIDLATESKRCQKVVLRDIKAHAQYAEELRSTVGSTDFLTELTRGQK